MLQVWKSHFNCEREKNASSLWMKLHLQQCIEKGIEQSTIIPQWCVFMEGKGNRSCFQHDYKLLFLLNAVMLLHALMKVCFQQITSFWYCFEKKDLTAHRKVWQSRTSCVLFRIIRLWGWCPSFGQLDITEAKALVFISLSYWFLPSFIIFLPIWYIRIVPLGISFTCLW